MPISLSNESLLILIISQLLVATALMALIWCVQTVIYPQFKEIGEPYWHDYHQHYMTRFARVVVPLMLLEIALAGGSLFFFSDRVFPIIGFLFIGGVWGSTGLVQVPLHLRLGRGFNPEIWRKLVLTNWIRTGLWTARWGFLIYWLIQAGTET